MKKFFIFAVLSVMAVGNSFGQEAPVRKNVVGLASGTLMGRVRIKYEYLFNDKISLGTMVSIYPDEQMFSFGGEEDYYKGFMVSPFARYYFKDNAGSKWYAQVKLNVGNFTERYQSHRFADFEWVDDPDVEEGEYMDGESFVTFGIGANIGYQWIFGKKQRWSLDGNIGLKYCTSGDIRDKSQWQGITEAGSILDTHFSVGYRF